MRNLALFLGQIWVQNKQVEAKQKLKKKKNLKEIDHSKRSLPLYNGVPCCVESLSLPTCL